MNSARRLFLFSIVMGVNVLALRSHAQPGDAAAPVKVNPPAAARAMAPKLFSAMDNTALLTWLEPVPHEEPDEQRPSRSLRLRFSRFDGERWSEPRTIIERDDFFANWADVPSIVQAKDGSLLAHWLQKSGPDTYSYDVMLARSVDGGQTWNALGPLHDDATKTEHGFVSLVPEGEAVRAFWLDGREMAPQDEDDHSHGGGNMTLRSALIEGDTINRSDLLDMRVCECCNTSATVSDQGPIVVYRDRTEQETRDIGIVRRISGRWADPKPIHEDGWQIAGCPVNGPAIAARGNQVAVAWFTSAQERPRVLIAFSSDAGQTFAVPITIDRAAPYGRVAVVMLKDGSAIVCWYANDDAAAAVRLVCVRADGSQGEVKTVGQTMASRSSGFPTIAPIGDRVLVVWTEAGETPGLRGTLIEH